MITVSTRAAAGVYEDKSGPIIAAALDDLGFDVSGPVVVPDGNEVGAALRDAVAVDHAVVITTGGTGLSPGDHTPSRPGAWSNGRFPSSRPRSLGTALIMVVPAAVLSRGVAGVAARTLVVNLPVERRRPGRRWLCWVSIDACDQPAARWGPLRWPAWSSGRRD